MKIHTQTYRECVSICFQLLLYKPSSTLCLKNISSKSTINMPCIIRFHQVSTFMVVNAMDLCCSFNVSGPLFTPPHVLRAATTSSSKPFWNAALHFVTNYIYSLLTSPSCCCNSNFDISNNTLLCIFWLYWKPFVKTTIFLWSCTSCPSKLDVPNILNNGVNIIVCGSSGAIAPCKLKFKFKLRKSYCSPSRAPLSFLLT